MLLIRIWSLPNFICEMVQPLWSLGLITGRLTSTDQELYEWWMAIVLSKMKTVLFLCIVAILEQRVLVKNYWVHLYIFSFCSQRQCDFFLFLVEYENAAISLFTSLQTPLFCSFCYLTG
jgi:hypothetical protein